MTYCFNVLSFIRYNNFLQLEKFIFDGHFIFFYRCSTDNSIPVQSRVANVNVILDHNSETKIRYCSGSKPTSNSNSRRLLVLLFACQREIHHRLAQLCVLNTFSDVGSKRASCKNILVVRTIFR